MISPGETKNLLVYYINIRQSITYQNLYDLLEKRYFKEDLSLIDELFQNVLDELVTEKRIIFLEEEELYRISAKSVAEIERLSADKIRA